MSRSSRISSGGSDSPTNDHNDPRQDDLKLVVRQVVADVRRWVVADRLRDVGVRRVVNRRDEEAQDDTV